MGVYAFGVGLVLTLIQTVCLPWLNLERYAYDLLIPLVLFVALYRPFREGLAAVFFWGGFMDLLSAGPFGYYFCTYCWIFAGVRWMLVFFRPDSWLIVPSLAVLAAGVAYGIAMAGLHLIGACPFQAGEIHTGLLQLLGSLLTTPLLLLLIDLGWRQWRRLFHFLVFA